MRAYNSVRSGRNFTQFFRSTRN